MGIKVQGSGGPRAVAEYQRNTSPRMRVRHFNIASVAWSNFKPGVNINGRVAVRRCRSIQLDF